MTKTLSPQQEVVRNFPRTHRGSAFAEAVAGAGKTTTAMFMIAETTGTVGVMAYNKSAAREFETKAAELGLNFGNRVRFGTCHSFGFGAWRYVHKNVKAGPEAAREKTDAMIAQAKLPRALWSFVPKLIGLAKQRAIGLYGSIDDQKLYYDIIEHFDLDHEIEDEGLIKAGVGYAIQGMHWHKLTGPDIIDFDDMIWLPVVTGVRMFGNDWIVGDEWQDANPARRALARKMLKPNGRALFIGDRHQAIYGFCHPAGTMVKTPNGETPIEQLGAGDAIIGSNTSGDVAGWSGSNKVLATHIYDHSGMILTLSAAGRNCSMTPHHKVPVRIDDTAKFYTYMMQRQGVYRVGYCAANTTERFMFSQRCVTERADCGWLLGSHANKIDALDAENILLSRVKGTTFNVMSDDEVRDLAPETEEALKILSEHGRMADFPLWIKGKRQHFEVNLPFITEACNIMDGMRVAFWSEGQTTRSRSRQKFVWTPVSVNAKHFSGKVYGITVPAVPSLRDDPWPLYFGGDGILVHNTGADNDSIDRTIKDFNCIELPMTVTFRCPKAVVERAQTVVKHIEAHESAPEGTVAETDERAFWQRVDGYRLADQIGDAFHPTEDALLCRNTKPLVATAFQLIKRGIPCHVEGRDIGAGLIKLIERFSSARTMATLRDRMTAYKEQQMQKLIAKGKETQAQSIEDKVDTVLVIADSCKSIDELKSKIQSMFQDAEGERKPTLTLSTVHKSKGREWQRVFILGANIYMPSSYARQDWQLEQENNLVYVAVTRAKSELVFVDMERA